MVVHTFNGLALLRFTDQSNKVTTARRMTPMLHVDYLLSFLEGF
jgi:hypothetical protein